MTYAADLAAAGKGADQAIALITKQPPGTAHAAAGGALGALWDADVAAAVPPPPPPPPPPAGLLLGSSCGGYNAADVASTLAQMPKAHILRIYTGGSPTTIGGNAQFAAAVAAMKKVGGEVWYSFKGMPTDSGFIMVLADWAAAGIKVRWTYKHEADNPAKHENPAQFVKDFEHLISVANAHPHPTVEEQSIFMAYLLDPAKPHGDPEAFYVPSARTLGFDCYVLANLPRVQAYARGKGKPYSLPEWGGGGKSDTAALAFAKAFVGLHSVQPSVGGCWFNADGTGASTFLHNIPKTTAFLNALT